MLLLSIDSLDLPGAYLHNSTCQNCGNQRIRQLSLLPYVSFAGLPLIPLKQRPATRCCRCYKIVKSTAGTLPTKTIQSIFSRSWGWLGIALLAAFVWLTTQQFYPRDEYIRQAPQIGDKYFINYYQLTRKAEESVYPLKMARVVAVDKAKRLVQIQPGTWSYKTLWKITNDYFHYKDAYHKNFYQDKITLPWESLHQESLVLQARRRAANIDLEKAQRLTEQAMKMASYSR